jgi:nitroreductase
MMDTFDAIAGRRSIRRFSRRPIPREQIERLLVAATQAPSGKNLQPWRFAVLRGAPKTEMVDTLLGAVRGIRDAGMDVGSAPWSARIMHEAPAVVVVLARPVPEEMKRFEEGMVRVNLQSIGAAIQNLCLAATATGLGSLWIADVLYGGPAIETLLAEPGETLVAAVALGFPEEEPPARPRRPLEETVEWKGGEGS